jgi:hypothetical protein
MSVFDLAQEMLAFRAFRRDDTPEMANLNADEATLPQTTPDDDGFALNRAASAPTQQANAALGCRTGVPRWAAALECRAGLPLGKLPAVGCHRWSERSLCRRRCEPKG